MIFALLIGGKKMEPKNNFLTDLYPQLSENLLSPQQREYYRVNGGFHLLKSLQVEVVWEINECQKLWKKFSSYQTLFDTWSFRLAFWRGYQYQPYFLVLKNTHPQALLPLWYDQTKKHYTWFGSDWQEENKFFAKDPQLVPLLMAACPTPASLNAISLDLPSELIGSSSLKPDEPKYILKLNHFQSADDYLATLSKKKRYNLRRDQRIIQRQRPVTIFNRFSDLEKLINLSMKRFQQKGEETDWEDPRRRETFRQVIKLGQEQEDYQLRMLTVVVGRMTAAVDLIVLFNNCYYPLKCGYDVRNFPGIGNYVNLLEIEDALSLGMEKMDFLEIGYGWKDKWFEEVPLLKYEKASSG